MNRRFLLVAAAIVLLGFGLAAATLLRQHGQRAPASSQAETGTETHHVDLRAGENPNLAVVSLTDAELSGRGITRVPLGALELRTGAIIAADPVVQPDRPAFARKVASGRYAVMLYRAQSRVALAELRFAPGTPLRWQMALVPGQDARTLKEDEIFGYPVDAGLGSFMDVTGRDALNKRDAQEQARLGQEYVSSYDDVVREPLDAAGGDAVLLKPLPEDAANVAVFSSGWGDGVYASYWGLDASGRPVVLVTDFGVLENGDGRSPETTAFTKIVAAMTPEQRRDSAEGYAALKRDDLDKLGAMLSEGRITPETPIEEVGATFTFEAIRLDKPKALYVLVRHGAPHPLPGFLSLGDAVKTYPDYARALGNPRSPELLTVIQAWERGDSASPATGSPDTPSQGTNNP